MSDEQTTGQEQRSPVRKGEQSLRREIKVARALALRKQGLTYLQIAERMRIGESTVGAYLRSAGLRVKTPAPWSETDLERLIWLVNNTGLTFEEIGRRINRTKDEVAGRVFRLRKQRGRITRARRFMNKPRL